MVPWIWCVPWAGVVFQLSGLSSTQTEGPIRTDTEDGPGGKAAMHYRDLSIIQLPRVCVHTTHLYICPSVCSSIHPINHLLLSFLSDPARPPVTHCYAIPASYPALGRVFTHTCPQKQRRKIKVAIYNHPSCVACCLIWWFATTEKSYMTLNVLTKSEARCNAHWTTQNSNLLAVCYLLYTWKLNPFLVFITKLISRTKVEI